MRWVVTILLVGSAIFLTACDPGIAITMVNKSDSQLCFYASGNLPARKRPAGHDDSRELQHCGTKRNQWPVGGPLLSGQHQVGRHYAGRRGTRDIWAVRYL